MICLSPNPSQVDYETIGPTRVQKWACTKKNVWLKQFNISSQLYSRFSCNFIHNPLHICGFQYLKTQYINIYIYIPFHTLPAGGVFKRWYPSKCWFGVNHHFPPQVKKKNKETTTTTNLLWETKKYSNCSNHLQSGHLFGRGRWGSTR